VPLNVDFVELPRDWRDKILLHFDCHVLGKNREKKALLKNEEKSI
jgi:hypothetical protein